MPSSVSLWKPCFLVYALEKRIEALHRPTFTNSSDRPLIRSNKRGTTVSYRPRGGFLYKAVLSVSCLPAQLNPFLFRCSLCLTLSGRPSLTTCGITLLPTACGLYYPSAMLQCIPLPVSKIRLPLPILHLLGRDSLPCNSLYFPNLAMYTVVHSQNMLVIKI